MIEALMRVPSEPWGSGKDAMGLRRLVGPWRHSGLAGGIAFAACLLFAQGAVAKVTCRLDLSTRVLSVQTTGGLFDEPVIHRVGERIVVQREFLGAAVACPGSPTVTNTDRIKLTLRNFGESEIQLEGGPLEPGATPEPGSSPEIEVAVSGSGTVFLQGGSHPEHFRYMSAAGTSGVNLNAAAGDQDIDLTLAPRGFTELFLDGGAGADVIEVVGHPKLEVAAFGGAGDDTLFSRRGEGLGGSLLEGDSGDDRIVGGPGDEGIYPGPGRDVVMANAGADFIYLTPDRRKDRIDCGPGHDLLLRDALRRAHESVVDRKDRLRSCGRVRRASAHR